MRLLQTLRCLHLHFLLGWALVAVTLYLVCFKVPLEEKNLGVSYLIFFYHFPSAVNCLNLFVTAGGIAVAQLIWRSARVDLAAASAIEVGLLACSICLATGMVWAKAAWGKPWIWHDPRLLSVAIMWLCYLAYLVFRANVDNPEQRARFCSVMAVLFALNVPMVYFAIRWFDQVSHPMEVSMGEPIMILTRWFGAGAFLVLYTALWRLRYRGMVLRDATDRLDEAFMAARI